MEVRPVSHDLALMASRALLLDDDAGIALCAKQTRVLDRPPRHDAMLGSPTPPLAFEGPRSATAGYRSDIDGLRAVAVLAVILFHAAAWVPGGYVGVDGFFVISGFLITGQIAAELDDGRFSLATFWVRRVRRIWPAAFAVTIAVLAAGWLLLMPRDYVVTAKDAMAQSLMLANVHLSKNVGDGYFAASSDSRPLLHMWSLAVEEQFYVFLPLALVALWRIGRNRCAWLLGLLALASFAASVAWLPSQPKAVFYLLPFRAWELLLGSLVALVAGRPADASSPPRPRFLAEAASLLGLGMMLGCFFTYARATPFPAAAAVPPCLGAALVIAACSSPASRAPMVNRLLSLQPLPAIGKVSYSLYLWHWPVLAFIRYCIAEPSARWTLAAMVAVLPVSYLSWRWIEQPFRLRSGHALPAGPVRSMSIAAWRPVLVGSVAWIVVCAAGGLIVRKAGIPSRWNSEERQFMESGKWSPGVDRFVICGFNDRERFLDDPLPARQDGDVFPRIGAESGTGGTDFLLWGDSHGQAIAAVIDSAARAHGMCGRAALMSGTPPLPCAWIGMTQRERGICEKWSRMVMDWIRENRPRHVLVCANWRLYRKYFRRIDGDSSPHGPDADALRDGLQRMLSECEAVGTRVTLMMQVPTQDMLPKQRVILARFSGRGIDLAGIGRAALDRQQAEIAAAVAGVAADDLRVVNLADAMFGPDGTSSVGDAGGSWYADRGHISGYGAERLFSGLLDGIMASMAAERGDDGAAKPAP